MYCVRGNAYLQLSVSVTMSEDSPTPLSVSESSSDHISYAWPARHTLAGLIKMTFIVQRSDDVTSSQARWRRLDRHDSKDDITLAQCRQRPK